MDPVRNRKDRQQVELLTEKRGALGMNRNNYTISGGKGRVKTVIAIVALLGILAAWAVTFALDRAPETWDSVHPIANAAISWEQTYYGGVMVE